MNIVGAIVGLKQTKHQQNDQIFFVETKEFVWAVPDFSSIHSPTQIFSKHCTSSLNQHDPEW